MIAGNRVICAGCIDERERTYVAILGIVCYINSDDQGSNFMQLNERSKLITYYVIVKSNKVSCNVCSKVISATCPFFVKAYSVSIKNQL